ncbi:MAG: substrate-binding domain-containing protein [bacterium]
MTLLVTAVTACGRRSKHRHKPHGSGKHGPPVTVTIAVAPETKPLLERLERILSKRQPPLQLKLTGDAPRDTVLHGKATLGLVAGPGLNPFVDTQPPIRAHHLGTDTVAVIANATNPIDRLSLGDLRLILTGQVTDWREVRGPRLPLVAFSLPQGRGVGAALRRLVGGKGLDILVRQVRDVATLLESVRRTPGGIGLLALYQLPRGDDSKLTPRGLKMLALSPTAGTPGYLAMDRAAAIKGQYPLLLPVTLLERTGTEGLAGQELQKLLQPTMLPHLGAQIGLIPRLDPLRKPTLPPPMKQAQ